MTINKLVNLSANATNKNKNKIKPEAVASGSAAWVLKKNLFVESLSKLKENKTKSSSNLTKQVNKTLLTSKYNKTNLFDL